MCEPCVWSLYVWSVCGPCGLQCVVCLWSADRLYGMCVLFVRMRVWSVVPLRGPCAACTDRPGETSGTRGCRRCWSGDRVAASDWLPSPCQPARCSPCSSRSSRRARRTASARTAAADPSAPVAGPLVANTTNILRQNSRDHLQQSPAPWWPTQQTYCVRTAETICSSRRPPGGQHNKHTASERPRPSAAVAGPLVANTTNVLRQNGRDRLHQSPAPWWPTQQTYRVRTAETVCTSRRPPGGQHNKRTASERPRPSAPVAGPLVANTTNILRQNGRDRLHQSLAPWWPTQQTSCVRTAETVCTSRRPPGGQHNKHTASERPRPSAPVAGPLVANTTNILRQNGRDRLHQSLAPWWPTQQTSCVRTAETVCTSRRPPGGQHNKHNASERPRPSAPVAGPLVANTTNILRQNGRDRLHQSLAPGGQHNKHTASERPRPSAPVAGPLVANTTNVDTSAADKSIALLIVINLLQLTRFNVFFAINY